MRAFGIFFASLGRLCVFGEVFVSGLFFLLLDFLVFSLLGLSFLHSSFFADLSTWEAAAGARILARAMQ